MFTKYPAGCFALKLDVFVRWKIIKGSKTITPNQESYFLYLQKDDRVVPVDFVTEYNIL